MGFLKFIDKALGFFVPKTEEHLTAEQVEKEKIEFIAKKSERLFQEIRQVYFSFSRQKCRRRSDGKKHYINDCVAKTEPAIIGQASNDEQHVRISLRCAFCGELDYWWEWLNSEVAQRFIDSGEYKK